MTSVAHILPFTHSVACEERAIGNNVLALIEAGETILDLSELAAIVDANPRPACDCGQRALRLANESLRLARKQRDAYLRDADRLFVADPAYANALEFRVLELKGRRDAIKAAIA